MLQNSFTLFSIIEIAYLHCCIKCTLIRISTWHFRSVLMFDDNPRHFTLFCLSYIVLSSPTFFTLLYIHFSAAQIFLNMSSFLRTYLHSCTLLRSSTFLGCLSFLRCSTFLSCSKFLSCSTF